MILLNFNNGKKWLIIGQNKTYYCFKKLKQGKLCKWWKEKENMTLLDCDNSTVQMEPQTHVFENMRGCFLFPFREE